VTYFFGYCKGLDGASLIIRVMLSDVKPVNL